MDFSRETGVTLLLIVSVTVTAAIYLLLLPRTVAAGDTGLAVSYVLIGWIPYTMAFFAAGRRFSRPGRLPSMRPADVGLALVLVALLVSLGLANWGLTPDRAPDVHLVQGVVISVGLALLGWAIGRRSAAIAEIDLRDVE